MKLKIFSVCMLLASSLFAAPISKEEVAKLKAGLEEADSKLARAAMEACAAQGKEFLPTLRKWANSTDPRLRLRSRNALGMITGQWGSYTDVIWNRSMKDAIKESEKTKKPILMLHLFGSLDEEFC